MPGRLASPRFRRRAIKGGLLLAVLGAGALVSVLYWNTATIVETPLHGRAELYVPPIPVKLATAERRRVIATAARFVETAVKRDHAEEAYELVGPNLRNGTTLAHWRDGDIPVVPYPVDDARWEFDYSYRDEIEPHRRLAVPDRSEAAGLGLDEPRRCVAARPGGVDRARPHRPRDARGDRARSLPPRPARVRALPLELELEAVVGEL